MRAWEIRDSALEMREVARPRADAGDSVIDVSHIGLCGSDIPKLVNPRLFDLPSPWRPGHEIVGKEQSGRLVAIDPLIPYKTCSNCEVGWIHLCAELRRVGWDLPGGFAEQVLVPLDNTYPISCGLDPAHAVLADPAAVAVHGLRCNGNTPPGRLAVIGAGPVGLLTALYGHEEGWTVTVVHRDGRPPSEAVANTIPARFGPPAAVGTAERFDVVVDAAAGGDAGPLVLALSLVADGGTIVVQNAYHPNVTLPVPLRDVFRRSIRLLGSFSYCHHDDNDFSLALALLQRNARLLEGLVAETVNVAELPEVLSGGQTGSTRRVLTI